ncbi:MAG TPA: anhydro-N-acetylmuramic acid kinase [Marinagarivorans sp.]
MADTHARSPAGSGLYIGLMSGTSVDGVDGVVAEISPDHINIVAHHNVAFDTALAAAIEQLFTPSNNEIDQLGALDKQLARIYTQCVQQLLAKSQLLPSAITAIGNHGQTLRHRPNLCDAFSLQIGDPSWLATHTGIPVVSDFRRADMVLGGQGAPLTPAFHLAAFGSPTEDRCIVNIGGIANITQLPANGVVRGWDTGPGNGLMDAWIKQQQNLPFDKDGAWAASGKINQALLTHLLDHPYFTKTPPKSTGKEEFTLAPLAAFSKTLAAQDIQATLLELTAVTISQGIREGKAKRALLCGGGAFNRQLVKRLQAHNPDVKLQDTQCLGIAPCWVEAAAFAWLAHQYWHKLPGNLPSVTGASRLGVLGSLTLPA